jgi:putative peptide zinc metalloprotease protein
MMPTQTLPAHEPAAASGPLFSDSWHRVKDLRPQLRNHVECRLQMHRGEAFHVLRDTGSDASLRLNREAYAFVGRCNGSATVQQIWDSLAAANPGQDTLTQPEAMGLLVGLHQRGLMQFDVTPDIEAMFLLSGQRARQRRRTAINPLAFRLPLGNPARIVVPLERRLRPLMSWPSAVVWLLLVLAGTLTAAMHAGPLATHIGQATASPGFLLLVWLSYPLIKVLHELAHAVCLQRWGVPVRQAGVSLLLLSPVPYVDASAADSLRSRHRRALVSAAGIATELGLAAAAVLLWVAVQPGLLRDMALAVALTGSLSTLLVNGNPLMRFDGYFVMCDLLDLRNLGPRSGRWWTQRLGRLITGLSPRVPLEPLPGEAGWLWLYAPLSLAWRLGLTLAVAVWAGGHAAWLGWALGIALLHAHLLAPLWRAWRTWRDDMEQPAHHTTWPRLRVGGVLLALAALLLAVPMPWRTVAEGVVWLPDQARLRAGTAGFVVALHAQDGQQVRAGQLVALLEDPPLLARRASAASELAELDVRLFHAQDHAPQDAPALREQLLFAQAELARLDEQLAQRELRAQTDGLLVLPPQHEVLGRFFKRGEALGHVLTDAGTVVRVALPQQQAELVQASTSARVRLADAPTQELGARVLQQVPGTQSQLPSAALGERGGGPFGVDPTDTQGLKALAPVVVLDVALDAPATTGGPTHAQPRFGGRAHVRFDHPPTPLATQWLRALRQLVLGHFNAT